MQAPIIPGLALRQERNLGTTDSVVGSERAIRRGGGGSSAKVGEWVLA